MTDSNCASQMRDTALSSPTGERGFELRRADANLGARFEQGFDLAPGHPAAADDEYATATQVREQRIELG